MTAWPGPPTLEALLTDPMTLQVMRSDDVSLADTARILREARRALLAREVAPPTPASLPWQVRRLRPCA